MLVTGLRKAYCIVLFGGNHTKIYELDADETIETMLLQEEQKWWSYVVDNVMPPIDASNAAKELLDSTFKGGDSEEIELPKEAQQYLDMYFEGQLEVEKAKEKIQLATNTLKQYLKDNNIAILNEHKVCWTPISSARLDSKKLKEELPDVYKQYTKISESRRFTIK
jgi:predicted phage-related endonuclease